MRSFWIGETDFGIDESNSHFAIIESADGPRIRVEVVGDEEVFDRISDADGSEWAWAVYPPKLYLVDLPCQLQSVTGQFVVEADMEQLQESDAALYMMQHNGVDGVRVAMVPGESVRIAGRVDMLGNERDFRIDWEASDAM